MHYGEGAFWRPLSEEVMIPLQVATGCTHNACKFCDMYHAPFQVSAREEVSANIDEIARTAQSHELTCVKISDTRARGIRRPWGDLRAWAPCARRTLP